MFKVAPSIRLTYDNRKLVRNRFRNVLKKAKRVWTGRRAVAQLSAEDRELLREIRSRRLTYLSELKLASIAHTCRGIEEKELPGLFIEAGCALGGSTGLIASTKRAERPLQVYDVFGMIPPPSEEDTPDVHERYQAIVEGKSEGIGGDRYYGYEENLYKVVEANLRSLGIDLERESVSLIKGLVQDTLTVDQPVAFAHIDVDWYHPVKTCLERIAPHLVTGGSLILDDYNEWGGCRKATDEYFRDRAGQFDLDDSARSLKVTRVRSG